MGFNSMLIHECTIRRYVEDGLTDSHGQPTGAWQVWETCVKCNLQWRTVTELKNDGFVAVARAQVLFLKAGQDITEEDHVTDIMDIDGIDGIVVDGGPFAVEEVKLQRGRKREHHRECRLKRVKAGYV